MNEGKLKEELMLSWTESPLNVKPIDPVEVIVESPDVKLNKELNMHEETPLFVPAEKEELLKLFIEPNHSQKDDLILFQGLSCVPIH